MAKSTSNRIISTPSSYAKEHYIFVQEVGTLQSLEPHISKRQNLNSYLFFIVLDGAGEVSYENKKYRISAGDCVWLDCTRPYSHESSADNPWSLMWVHFYGAMAKSFYTSFIRQYNSFLFRPRNLVNFTDTLSQLYRTQQTKSVYMELLSHKYLTDIITLCFTENKTEYEGEYSIPEKLVQVHAYLEQHYHEKITLETLSERFFISKFHLSREYKKIYGITLFHDLTAMRISHAKSMLRFSDASIESIAIAVGFQDSGYFIKVFRSLENMTPLEYRKKW
ncbi:AraC family transcriptional regulator [Kineothrix sp. MB12-C1]|uniref:AraC family transcriptional regulator n=1 Tax=Kineothrix sp. MB12-C1 TaxID=3070215 RepID=UPI0027D25B8F|nr:AraC family transcriptional regulator [Kineothrix sp. MB12-C1]WMC91613.1 AraC family transcriptional regulator [Kineothrix sp. MB12-C1]